MRLLGLLVIAAIVAFAVLAGAAATVLVIAWAACHAAAGALVSRPHAHLDDTGVPSPGRVAAAQALYIASGVLVVVFAPGMVDGIVWRALVTVAPAAFSVVRLRQVFALPGANRLELALSVVADRKRPVAIAVLATGGLMLAGGVVVGVPFAGLPLVAGVAALVAWGWGPARVRAAAVRRLQMHVANATRVADANSVQIEPQRWLAQSDDVIDQAVAFLPATWVPPDPPDRMLEALRQVGYRAAVHHDRAIALDYQAPPEPLPKRITLDVDDAPAGLARVGWGIDPETGEQGWAWWDPDAADPHALVVGPTRSGKSVALRGLLSQALAGRWVVLISDPKGVDLQVGGRAPRRGTCERRQRV